MITIRNNGCKTGSYTQADTWSTIIVMQKEEHDWPTWTCRILVVFARSRLPLKASGNTKIGLNGPKSKRGIDARLSKRLEHSLFRDIVAQEHHLDLAKV